VGWSPGRALKFGLGWSVLHSKFGGKFGGGVGKFGGVAGKFGGVVDVTDWYGGEWVWGRGKAPPWRGATAGPCGVRGASGAPW